MGIDRVRPERGRLERERRSESVCGRTERKEYSPKHEALEEEPNRMSSVSLEKSFVKSISASFQLKLRLNEATKDKNIFLFLSDTEVNLIIFVERKERSTRSKKSRGNSLDSNQTQVELSA